MLKPYCKCFFDKFHLILKYLKTKQKKTMFSLKKNITFQKFIYIIACHFKKE